MAFGKEFGVKAVTPQALRLTVFRYNICALSFVSRIFLKTKLRT